jgi:hypothetical protein
MFKVVYDENMQSANGKKLTLLNGIVSLGEKFLDKALLESYDSFASCRSIRSNKFGSLDSNSK